MIQQLEQRVAQLEQYLRNSKYNTQAVVQSELKQNYRLEYSTSSQPSLFSALCVNTIDPRAEGRVQYFTPAKTAPGTAVSGMPWAIPISVFGGFDDCGVTWVPPAGSKLALFHENGDRNQAYYFGTFWTRTRGVDDGASTLESVADAVSSALGFGGFGGFTNTKNTVTRSQTWGYEIPEYRKLYEGTRDGYNLGSNQGDQDKMPWNTDNHQTKDWDTQTDFTANTNAKELATYPHQYGYKTPGKHYMKMVDGDAKCNHRWRRAEWATGCGNIFMMKDDHLHGPEWGFNQSASMQPCNGQGTGTDCQTVQQNNQKSQSSGDPEGDRTPTFNNQFYKRQDEMRFYQPVSALAQYQNPVCELQQSGIQFQSIGGAQFVMDDSVDQPQGEPTWKRNYDFGCTDMTKSKTFWRSQTGHVIELNDEESDTLIRSQNNGIRLQTGAGNRLQMNDHTIGSSGSPEMAGNMRGIVMESTSKHILELHDEGNKQFGPLRKEGGVPEALADQAYVMLRSGYGLQLMMMDSNSQENTQTQRIELLAPQKDNKTRGPHMLLFQEAAEDAEKPGFVLLRAGGNFVVNVYDDYEETVGTNEKPTPSNKVVNITGKCINNIGDYYFNKNNLTMFQSDTYIYLLAGRDCKNPDSADGSPLASAMSNAQIASSSGAQGVPNQMALDKTPCVHPVLVGKDPWVCPMFGFVHYGVMADPKDPSHTKLTHNSLSDRVFASASNDNKNE